VSEKPFGRDNRRGEENLIVAVLEDASKCFQKYAFAHNQWKKRLFEEVEDWILKKNSEWLYSFGRVWHRDFNLPSGRSEQLWSGRQRVLVTLSIIYLLPDSSCRQIPFDPSRSNSCRIKKTSKSLSDESRNLGMSVALTY